MDALVQCAQLIRRNYLNERCPKYIHLCCFLNNGDNNDNVDNLVKEFFCGDHSLQKSKDFNSFKTD